MNRLRILTFNCCAVPLATGDIDERLRRAGDAIAALDPDVVLCQEVYLERHARVLAAALARWPERIWRRRWPGAIAGGLLAFSRLPVARSRFVRFRHQGPLWGLAALSRLSGKGLLALRLDSPAVEVVNVHPMADFYFDIARGPRGGANPFHRHQARQLDEIAAFAAALDPGAPLVVAGDLNCPPSAPLLAGFIERLGLRDAMAGGAESSVIDGAFYRIAHRAVAGKRLDYVLVRAGASTGAAIERASLALTAPESLSSGRRTTLSDHLAVVADLSF